MAKIDITSLNKSFLTYHRVLLLFNLRLKKTIIFILVLVAFSLQVFGQSGGSKREKYRRKGPKRGNFLHKTYKSAGHADEFARGSNGRFNKYRKLFSHSKPAWTYRNVGTSKSNYKANRYLFTRYRSKGKIDNTNELYRRKKIRDRNRTRGSESFRRPRNYKSR